MSSLLTTCTLGVILACQPLLACTPPAETSVQLAPISGILRLAIRYDIAAGEQGDLSKSPQPDWQSEIKIRGKLADGTVFLDRTDSSNLLTIYPGFNNLEESLGLKYFPELALIGPGGKMTLQVPAENGFSSARGPVPENAALIFEIELVSTCDLDAEEKIQQAREDAYFDALLKANPDLIATPCGICYQILSPGSPSKAQRSDVCDIKLTATLVDNTPILTDEPVRLYRNFYNSDHALVIKHISELALLGEGGKIRLYVPFNQAFRHYKKPGIPPYSALIYDVELQKITEKAAQKPIMNYVPKHYSFYEEYPMLLRYPTEQGVCACCWAFAASNSATSRLGRDLIDKGLMPPGIRTPIVRDNQVIGYKHPGIETLEGRLSAQMLLSYGYKIDGAGCEGNNALLSLVYIHDNYLTSAKLAPYLQPSKSEEIPTPTELENQIKNNRHTLIPGGYSKSITGTFPEVLTGAKEMKQGLWLEGPITITMNHSASNYVLDHVSGILRQPLNSAEDDVSHAGIDWHVLSLVGWGFEGDELYWIAENSWGPIYFYDGQGPFSVENFSRGLIKISDNNDYFKIAFSNSIQQTIQIIDEDGKAREIDYEKDVFQDRFKDGFLPWPYLRP